MKPHLLLIVGILLAFGTMETSGQNQRRPAAQQRKPAAQQQARGFVTVQVTGKGETLELAREDAKKNALARVVGEAIKARTDVTENGDDAQVISQYISASAGFIAKFDETGTADDDGIFTVTANVTVYGEKLLEAVTFGNDSIEAAKEMQQARLGSDLEATREAMTKYITSYMLDYCRIWSVTVNKLIPDYDNNGQPVLYVNGRFGTTPAKYQMYTKRLDNALAHVGAKKTAGKYENYQTHNALTYCRKPDTQKKDDFWSKLWISKKYMEPLQAYFEEFKKWGYLFTAKLLDENGGVIQEPQVGIFFHGYNCLPFPGGAGGSSSDLRLHPLPGEHTASCYSRKIHFAFKDFASAEEMLKVKRVVFLVEPVRMSRHSLVKFHQYLSNTGVAGWGWVER